MSEIKIHHGWQLFKARKSDIFHDFYVQQLIGHDY